MSKADKDRIDPYVAYNIRRHRLLRQMSQQELADKIGVSFQQIQKYERAQNSPSTGRVRDLCGALRITLKALFDKKRKAMPPELPGPGRQGVPAS